MNIRLVNDFMLSVDAQRCIVVPFELSDNNEFVVASAMETVRINLGLTSGGTLFTLKFVRDVRSIIIFHSYPLMFLSHRCTS